MVTARIPIQEMLSRLSGVKPCGDGYTAACPAHHDMMGKDLILQELNESHTELDCRKGCAPSAIFSALELSRADSPSTASETKPQPEEFGPIADLPAQSHELQLSNGSASKTAILPIERIVASDDIKPRDAISDPLIQEYIEAYREGARMPRIEVYQDAQGTIWLADGRHRLEAQRQFGVGEVDAIVHMGDQADAMLHAAQANVAHGRRRGPGDAVAAACVAIRGLSLKHPGKRPTHREVMAAARVGKETVAKAYEAFDAASVAVGPKDLRGGSRSRFGTGSTKHQTAQDQIGESFGPEVPTPKTSAIDDEMDEIVDDATDADGRDDHAAALATPPRWVDAQTSSTLPTPLAVAYPDRAKAPEDPAEAIRRVHDGVDALVKYSPEHVARILDPESKNVLATTVDQLTAWWAHVEEVMSRLAADK